MMASIASDAGTGPARGDALPFRGELESAFAAHYRPLVGAQNDASANKAVAGIEDPLPRLIGAALLFRQTRAEPATLAQAVETASERGWRRPLLAWLEVSLRRARSAGDAEAAAIIQRRLDLVTQGARGQR